LTERRWHLSIFDVRFFRGADTGHYLAVAKVRERLSARKRWAQSDMERFNLSKLSEMGVKKQFQTKLWNKFEALENLNDSKDVNRVW
jgi:hypothetical protein